MRRDGKNEKNGIEQSSPLPPSHAPDRLLPPRGDYRTLHAFHKSEVVYDITFRFVHKFLSYSDRTIDQMIQSARSGKKVINQANYLIDRQLLRLEKDFLEQGGLRERMMRLRLEYRRTHPRP
jgi:four helix bundle suffix protein